MKIAENSIKGVFTHRIQQRLDYLRKLRKLTERLVIEAEAGDQERIVLMTWERQRILNRLKTCDQEDFRLINSTKINFEDFSELHGRLEQIEQISSTIKSMEANVDKVFEAGFVAIGQ